MAHATDLADLSREELLALLAREDDTLAALRTELHASRTADSERFAAAAADAALSLGEYRLLSTTYSRYPPDTACADTLRDIAAHVDASLTSSDIDAIVDAARADGADTSLDDFARWWGKASTRAGIPAQKLRELRAASSTAAAAEDAQARMAGRRADIDVDPIGRYPRLQMGARVGNPDAQPAKSSIEIVTMPSLPAHFRAVLAEEFPDLDEVEPGDSEPMRAECLVRIVIEVAEGAPDSALEEGVAHYNKSFASNITLETDSDSGDLFTWGHMSFGTFAAVERGTDGQRVIVIRSCLRRQEDTDVNPFALFVHLPTKDLSEQPHKIFEVISLLLESSRSPDDVLDPESGARLSDLWKDSRATVVARAAPKLAEAMSTVMMSTDMKHSFVQHGTLGPYLMQGAQVEVAMRDTDEMLARAADGLVNTIMEIARQRGTFTEELTAEADEVRSTFRRRVHKIMRDPDVSLLYSKNVLAAIPHFLDSTFGQALSPAYEALAGHLVGVREIVVTHPSLETTTTFKNVGFLKYLMVPDKHVEAFESDSESSTDDDRSDSDPFPATRMVVEDVGSNYWTALAAVLGLRD